MKVHGVPKYRVLNPDSRLQPEIMVATDAEDQPEPLTTEPVVKEINCCIGATETICAVAAVNQYVTREYAELFMFLVRVAYDDDLHASILAEGARGADGPKMRDSALGLHNLEAKGAEYETDSCEFRGLTVRLALFEFLRRVSGHTPGNRAAPVHGSVEMETTWEPNSLPERVQRFLKGPRCIDPKSPPTDHLIEQWAAGMLANDLATIDELRAAIERSRARVAHYDAYAPLSGPQKDARWCFATRAWILEQILRDLKG